MQKINKVTFIFFKKAPYGANGKLPQIYGTSNLNIDSIDICEIVTSIMVYI